MPMPIFRSQQATAKPQANAHAGCWLLAAAAATAAALRA
jgi:hypothetical protein